MAMASYKREEEVDEDEETSASESEEDEDQAVAVARKDATYNVVALHEKLEDIRWPEDLKWIETLSLAYAEQDDDAPDVDANDDLAREMGFYTQALEAAREAYVKLQHLGVAFLRPADYYAEMVKSDKHMFKVKDKLLFQQKQMEEAEERRKARDAKRFAKEVQTEKMKDRAREKKQSIESVKKWRKMRKQSGFSEGGGDDFPVDLEDGLPESKRKKVAAAPWDRSGGRRGKPSGGHGRKGMNMFNKEDGGIGSKRAGRGPFRGGRGGGSSKSREYRDSKFGFGGKKSSKKKNTAESSAYTGGFRGRSQRSGKR